MAKIYHKRCEYDIYIGNSCHDILSYLSLKAHWAISSPRVGGCYISCNKAIYIYMSDISPFLPC